MGQTTSYPEHKHTPRHIANFYHVCNIIPDTPEHHHQIWTPENDVRDTPTSHSTQMAGNDHYTSRNRDANSVTHRYGRVEQDNRKHTHATTSSHLFANSSRDTDDYTTDDESDVFQHRHRHRRRTSRRSTGRNTHTHTRAHTPAASIDDTMRHSSLHRASTTAKEMCPEMLDRRYDLDVAPSMINMDLRFNGAYMVVNNVYNILVCKFGYQHMLSVQMLFWMAIHKYYQIHTIDISANYKLSLSTLLDVVQHLSLCSERDLSIYTKLPEKYGTSHTEKSNKGSSTKDTSSPHTTFSITSLVTQHMYSEPFYKMKYYYLLKDEDTIKQALVSDHLVLANLTLFSNFLSSRGGVVQFPNSTDTSAGMIVVTLVGYQNDAWIVRFPFGMHWGDQGVGYVSFEYFNRYNRDRWLIDIEECSEPPEYVTQRKKEQLHENSELLAAHMDSATSCGATHPPTHTSVQHLTSNIQQHHRRRII